MIKSNCALAMNQPRNKIQSGINARIDIPIRRLDLNPITG